MYVYVSLYIYIYIVYLRKRISIYQDPPSMRVSIYVNISANAQSIFLLASPDEFKPTTQLNLHVSLLCQFWLPCQHSSLLWAQGLLCPLKKRGRLAEGRSERRKFIRVRWWEPWWNLPWDLNFKGGRPPNTCGIVFAAFAAPRRAGHCLWCAGQAGPGRLGWA